MKIMVETILHVLHLIGVRRNVLPLLLALTSLVAPSAAQGSPNHLAGSGSAYTRCVCTASIAHRWSATASS
jgi:hypothetical protein